MEKATLAINVLTQKLSCENYNIVASDNIFDDIIVNLKVIGQIPCDTKLSVHSGQLKMDSAINLIWFWRWVRGDSRKKSITYVKNVITNSIVLYNAFSQSNDKEHSLRIKDSLEGSVKGIENLMETYKDDANASASLSLLRDKIIVTLEESKKKKEKKDKKKRRDEEMKK